MGIGKNSIQAQLTTTSEAPGSFANVKVVQDSDYVVITVAKNLGEVIPDGPIVIIPPDVEVPGDNGTIEVPTIINETTDEVGGNVTIIDPSGEVTTVPDGNVTVIDEGTVVVTEPAADEQDCGCPTADESGIPNVTVTPAPGQNVTIGGEEEVPIGTPTDEDLVSEEPPATDGELPSVDEAPPAVEEGTDGGVNATEPAVTPEEEPATNGDSGGEITESSLNAALPWLGIPY